MFHQIDEEKILSLLGFAQKSHKIVSGDSAVKAIMKYKKIELLILASDISDKLKEKWSLRCSKAGIQILQVPMNKLLIGQAIGSSGRSCVAVLDRNFAQTIIEIGRKNMYT